MLEGLSGFNFNIKDYNQGLFLDDAWFALFGADAVWPPGNEETTVYEFDCLYDGAKIGDFQWLDYRGGILNAALTDDSENEVNRFHQSAEDSDALLVCLPADMLLNENNVDCRRMLQRYRNVLTKQGLDVKNKALVFMITKADLCKTEENAQACVRTVRKAFNRFFSKEQKNAMIALVQLGRFDGDNFEQGAPIDGDIEPYNIHLPILYPIYLDMEKEIRRLESLRDDSYKKAGRGQGAISKLIWGDNSKVHTQNALEYSEQIKKQKAIADRLWQELDGNVDIFYEGERIVNASGVDF